MVWTTLLLAVLAAGATAAVARGDLPAPRRLSPVLAVLLPVLVVVEG